MFVLCALHSVYVSLFRTVRSSLQQPAKQFPYKHFQGELHAAPDEPLHLRLLHLIYNRKAHTRILTKDNHNSGKAHTVPSQRDSQS